MKASEKLDARLRAEAAPLREKNGFSPILHQRIMGALRQQGLTAVPVQPERLRLWRFVGPLAAAAAVAFAAWLVLRPAPETPAPNIANKQSPIPEMPKIEMPKIAFAQPANPSAANSFEERKYAYLDRDARKLLAFVADQLPELPNPRK